MQLFDVENNVATILPPIPTIPNLANRWHCMHNTLCVAFVNAADKTRFISTRPVVLIRSDPRTDYRFAHIYKIFFINHSTIG